MGIPIKVLLITNIILLFYSNCSEPNGKAPSTEKKLQNKVVLVLDPKDCVNCIGATNFLLNHIKETKHPYQVHIMIVFPGVREKVASKLIEDIAFTDQQSYQVINDDDIYKQYIVSCGFTNVNSLIQLSGPSKMKCLNPKQINLSDIKPSMDEVFESL